MTNYSLSHWRRPYDRRESDLLSSISICLTSHLKINYAKDVLHHYDPSFISVAGQGASLFMNGPLTASLTHESLILWFIVNLSTSTLTNLSSIAGKSYFLSLTAAFLLCFVDDTTILEPSISHFNILLCQNVTNIFLLDSDCVYFNWPFVAWRNHESNLVDWNIICRFIKQLQQKGRRKTKRHKER